MKKFTKIFGLLISMLLIFGVNGCKKASEENGQIPPPPTSVVTLTVVVSDGVTGNPAPGTYTYDVGETVSYSYAPKPGYSKARVTLDGNEINSSGTFNMSVNRTLSAGTGLIDIRGIWTGLFKWNEAGSDMMEKEFVYFIVTFSGDILSGRAKGLFDMKPNDWGAGPFTIDGENITFKIEYWDDSWILCNGKILSETKMEGIWVFWSPWGFYPDGIWELELNPNAKLNRNKITVKKGKTNPFSYNK